MKRIMIISALAVLLTGCDKSYLDKKSFDSLDGDFVENTEKGMDLLLTGAYATLQSSHYYGGILYLYEAAKGPDFFVRNVSGGYSFYIENRYSESSTLNSNALNSWVKIYNVIRNTTILIEKIDDIAGDVDNLRRIKGEAYVLRGLAYFDLSRLFAYPPKFSCTWGSSYDEKFKWGLPLMTKTDMATNVLDYEITRATADETWEYIEKQLTLGYELLRGRMTEQGHANEAAALALLMRAHLYMEHYAKVIELGEKWLEDYEARYSLISYDSYPTQYYKPFNSESIWEIKYSESDNLGSSSLNYWVRRPTVDNPGSPLDGTVSQNLGYAKLGLTYGNAVNGYESMMSSANDVRKCLVCELGILGKEEYRTIRKYVGDPYHFVHNIPVVRLPEIYLTLAEAYFQVSDTDMAGEYASRVTSVRRKANMTSVNLNNILNERRREFILEGHTYWDWFRNGRNITNRPIMESISSGNTITFGSTSSLSYRVVYPIPLAEMNANPAIREQQNPGYAAWTFGVEDET